MSRTPAQAQAGVLALYPDGWTFRRDVDDYPAALELATGNEWSLVEQSMEAFEPELDPGTAQYLLPDYLAVLGPDPYGRDDLALPSALQSQIAHQRWVDAPIICPGYFVDSAAAVGLTITITEYPLPVMGDAVCGGATLNPWLSQCSFLVTLPTDDSWNAICGDCVCGDALGGFTPSIIENFIMQKAPLFTRAVFNYT
jgi:uncharacterized protein YmfQ (DUF2313 family)